MRWQCCSHFTSEHTESQWGWKTGKQACLTCSPCALLPRTPVLIQPLTFRQANMWTVAISGEDFYCRNLFLQLAAAALPSLGVRASYSIPGSQSLSGLKTTWASRSGAQGSVPALNTPTHLPIAPRRPCFTEQHPRQLLDGKTLLLTDR